MRSQLRFLVALWVAAMVCDATAWGQSVQRVEEDWELVVLEPDAELDAPQITTTMLPFGSQSEVFFQFDFNHAQTPAFSSGGWQVRVSDQDLVLASRRQLAGRNLSHENETVTWTQVIHQVPGGIFCGIVNGQSVSLGSFGGESSYVFVASEDASLGSLNGYRHTDSLANSGATYAGNRVAALRLKRIRVHDDVGQVTEWIIDQAAQ